MNLVTLQGVPLGVVATPPRGETTNSANTDGELTDLGNAQGDATTGAAPFVVPAVGGSPFPFQTPQGVPDRDARHPSSETFTHDVDPQAGGDLGVHGEVVYGASTPAGSQTPIASVQAKTWRAEPAPWDENIYAAFTSGGFEGDR